MQIILMQILMQPDVYNQLILLKRLEKNKHLTNQLKKGIPKYKP